MREAVPLDPESASVLVERREAGATIQVLQSGRYRWLQFDDGIAQSAIDRRAPARLVLPYARWLLGALPLLERIEPVCMLGLGGGALVRFLRAAGFEDIDVVERSPAVAELAGSHFQCQLAAERIHLLPAREYLATTQSRPRLLLCDLFDGGGMPAWLSHAAFYDQCRAVLRADGMLALNAIAYDDDRLHDVLRAVRQGFGPRVLYLRVPGTGNAAIFAFAGTPAFTARAALSRRARCFEARFELPFVAMINALFATNPSRGGRLFPPDATAS